MSNLSDYIDKIKRYKDKNPNISESKLIKYVYLDLGNRFSFDVNFLPFGNSKERQRIYRKDGMEYLNECMENNTVTCKSISKIFEIVLKNVDVDIISITDPEDCRKCPHVYNIIKQKNGKKYSVDLQEDMYNIQSHSFTKNFGQSLERGKPPVISRLEQEKIDKELGYIDDEKYYSDDYLYLLKSDIDYADDYLYLKNPDIEYKDEFRKRAKFVLENIDIYDNPNMKYTDRQWHHVRILEELFSKFEFNYENGDSKIKMVDCYKDVKGKRNYINCILVQSSEDTDIYMYNNKEYKYKQINIKDFAKAVNNGLIVHNCKIPGLGKELKKIKCEEQTR